MSSPESATSSSITDRALSLARDIELATLNGKPGISLEVRRQSGQNTLEVAKAIKA
jgi:multidrug efflux pump subunit AcrB